jgi:phospholipid/cholesterol/gamma-HCH transport system substrate-binding protein
MSENRVRLRHTDRWVGVLVLAAALLFLGALLQRGAIREWLHPSPRLVVLLPEQGTAGLGEGAAMEVLGTQAGTVRRVTVRPDRRLAAEVRVEGQATIFIRQDSKAVIRKRFGIAGAAYLDVERGDGPPLDWDGPSPPVIEASSERAPTETVGELLEQVQARLLPVIESVERGTHAFAVAMERLERGEGSVGRLLADDTLAREAEAAALRASAILERLEGAAADVGRLAAAAAGPDGGDGNGAAAAGGGVPGLLRRADDTLALLQRASRDLARATPALPRAARSVEQGAGSLPTLLVQTQETARELELLVNQLRGLWLLGGGTGSGGAGSGGARGVGGGGGPAAGARDQPPAAARPRADRIRP